MGGSQGRSNRIDGAAEEAINTIRKIEPVGGKIHEVMLKDHPRPPKKQDP